MKTKLLIIGIFIFLVQSISASNFYYDVSVYSENNLINIQSVKIIFSQAKIDNFFNENFNKKTIKIKSNEKILEESYFSVPNKEIFDIKDLETGDFIEGEVNELENVSFNLFVPYYEDGKEIVIYDENEQEVVRKDISEYLKLDKDIEGEIGKGIEAGEGDLVKRKVDSIKKISVFEWILFIVLVLLVLYLVYYIMGDKNLKKRK